MKPERKKTMIRLHENEYRLIRKLAYLKEMSMNSLIELSIKEMIAKDKKMLTNADVVIS